jgi:hypothetical protein
VKKPCEELHYASMLRDTSCETPEKNTGENNHENKLKNKRDNDKQTSFGVAPSPFNRVKLELGIIIVTGTLLLIGLDSIIEDALIQTGLLFLAGILGMVWIMWRSYKVVKQQRNLPNQPDPSEEKLL